MKVNQMKTPALREKLNQLTTTRPPKYTIGDDRKKSYTEFGKGNEAESQYAQHIREELVRRAL